ncbi:hypothetical protein HDV00_010314 [Rhizophlyctis rosea]|nr:hypothetical protein HDV00_010314 [Rhizophlyctis rosea]
MNPYAGTQTRVIRTYGKKSQHRRLGNRHTTQLWSDDDEEEGGNTAEGTRSGTGNGNLNPVTGYGRYASNSKPSPPSSDSSSDSSIDSDRENNTRVPASARNGSGQGGLVGGVTRAKPEGRQARPVVNTSESDSDNESTTTVAKQPGSQNTTTRHTRKPLSHDNTAKANRTSPEGSNARKGGHRRERKGVADVESGSEEEVYVPRPTRRRGRVVESPSPSVSPVPSLPVKGNDENDVDGKVDVSGRREETPLMSKLDDSEDVGWQMGGNDEGVIEGVMVVEHSLQGDVVDGDQAESSREVTINRDCVQVVDHDNGQTHNSPGQTSQSDIATIEQPRKSLSTIPEDQTQLPNTTTIVAPTSASSHIPSTSPNTSTQPQHPTKSITPTINRTTHIPFPTASATHIDIRRAEAVNPSLTMTAPRFDLGATPAVGVGGGRRSLGWGLSPIRSDDGWESGVGGGGKGSGMGEFSIATEGEVVFSPGGEGRVGWGGGTDGRLGAASGGNQMSGSPGVPVKELNGTSPRKEPSPPPAKRHTSLSPTPSHPSPQHIPSSLSPAEPSPQPSPPPTTIHVNGADINTLQQSVKNLSLSQPATSAAAMEAELVRGMAGLVLDEPGGKPRGEEAQKAKRKAKRAEDRRKTMARRMTMGGVQLVQEIGIRDLLQLCDQTAPLPFERVLDLSTITSKLGEATYSEVFSLMYHGRSAALKVIPFGDVKAGQPDVKGVVQEVRIARCLTERVGGGFVELLGVGVCRGPYPKRLLELWDRWEVDMGKESENESPDTHPATQLYALLILTNGGRDLEHVLPTQITSHDQIRSILVQVMVAVARAERRVGFEHRDLHWGNVLVRESCGGGGRRKGVVGGDGDGAGGKWEVEFEGAGMEVTVIDFTLGRVEDGGEVYYVPLNDEEFFTGKGKGKRGGDLQFDIYRWMREETKERWEDFHPKTNVFWLHYLIDKHLTHAALFSAKSRGRDGGGREEKRELVAFRERVLECGSVGEVLEREVERGEGYFWGGGGGWEVKKVG